VRFGLALPHYGFSFPDGGPVTFDRVAKVALEAERLGFDSVWASDHFYLSIAKYGGGEDLHDALEPVTTLAGLAAVTSRIRLGTLVLSAPFRHPAVLAKSVSTLDLFAGGRVDLGIGSGWYEPEFEDFGYDFASTSERFRALGETLTVLRLLFGGGSASFDGEFFHLKDAVCIPRSPQEPRLPVWLGAKGGPKALRFAALHADGWNAAWKWTPESYAEKAIAADRACEQEGRDPATLRRSIGLYSLVGENDLDLVEGFRAMQRWMPHGALDGELLEDWMRDTLSGTPERVLDLVAQYAQLGVEEIIISPSCLPFALCDLSRLEVFAQEVIVPAKQL